MSFSDQGKPWFFILELLLLLEFKTHKKPSISSHPEKVGAKRNLI